MIVDHADHTVFCKSEARLKVKVAEYDELTNEGNLWAFLIGMEGALTTVTRDELIRFRNNIDTVLLLTDGWE